MADPTTVFQWRIANLERHTANGIVFTAHYTVDASNGTYNSGAYGSVGLEQPDPENTIPYAELTEEIVVGWVKEKLGDETVTNVEVALQNQLDEQAAPTKAAGVPWAN